MARPLDGLSVAFADRWSFTPLIVPDAREHDAVSLLARSIAERIAPLCAHVPGRELEQLTSRLAWMELAGSTAPDHDAADPVAPACGNQLAWLPGAAGAAVVLPAGVEERLGVPSLAQLKSNALRHAASIRTICGRSSVAIRRFGVGLLHTYQARPGTGLSDR